MALIVKLKSILNELEAIGPCTCQIEIFITQKRFSFNLSEIVLLSMTIQNNFGTFKSFFFVVYIILPVSNFGYVCWVNFVWSQQTLTLIYICINHGDQRVYSIWNHHIVILFVRGPSLYVSIWRPQTADSDMKTVPALKEYKYYF